MSPIRRSALAFLAAAGVAATLPAATATAAPASPGHVNSCSGINLTSLNKQIGLIEAALKPAVRDASKNGRSGTYAVAAINARDLLQRSKARMQEAMRQLSATDPSTTTYAEGGHAKEMIRPTFEWMSQAGHWALISATYHKSRDARDAFIATLPALDNATLLFGVAGRCLMSGYGL